ncbi:MAG: FtsX-like permease family protein [Kutzneria sp.]|nr:FtsX-like permease family protein [Kutzneria sp.]
MTYPGDRSRRTLLSTLGRWFGDLAIGVRLVFGGGRGSVVRLALTAVGVGLGVMVLLGATSVPHMFQARADRDDARSVSATIGTKPVHGVDPVWVAARTEWFQHKIIEGSLVQLTGPNPPHAPGVARLPRPGEAVLSPALANLVNSPEGELLRPRFSQHVIGTIADDGLLGPNELYFYVGTDFSYQDHATKFYKFGDTSHGRTLTGLEWLLIALGAATFLVPVAVFVTTSTRFAASTRDRRLAALRLIGADGKQVRRIAAGEAFVGALAGLVVGAAMFLVVRSLVPRVAFSVLGGGIPAGDIRPDWPLVGLIAVVVPLLAIGVSILSLRRTVIEPLGVVRNAKQSRRRLLWRLAPVIAGAGLLTVQADKFSRGIDGSGQRPVIVGIVLLLTSVPVLVPWLVERVVWRMRGGAPSWQLAIRRLQLDSGSSARLVGGVAVALAGVIALQTLLTVAQSRSAPYRDTPTTTSVVSWYNSVAQSERLISALWRVPGVADVDAEVTGVIENEGHKYALTKVGSCAQLEVLAELDRCADGAVYYARRPASPHTQDDHYFVPAAGQHVWFDRDADRHTAQWTIPADLRVAGLKSAQDSRGETLLVTPAALSNAVNVSLQVNATVHGRTDDPGFVERVRNALFPFGWNSDASDSNSGSDSTSLLISRVLNLGSIITLLIAAANLTVAALEQIRERRRTLAILMATGVRRAVLASSLLWQVALPIAVAVVVAVAAGLGLATLLLRVTETPLAFDWATVAEFSAAGLTSVLVVTTLTLPSLWRTSGAEGLRSE